MEEFVMFGTFRSLSACLLLAASVAAYVTAAPTAAYAQTVDTTTSNNALSNGTKVDPLEVDGVYVFGDSLVDTGNVFNANGGVFPPSPPYFSGRFSNGPLWIENVLAPLGINLVPSTTAGGQNFAFGGAPSGFFLEQPIPLGGPPPETPGLLYQLGTFTQPAPQVTPQTLYFISAGSNDLLNDFLANRELDYNVPVQNLTTAVATLYAYGARNIVISNIPDLSRAPLTQVNPGELPTLKDQVKLANKYIKIALQELKQSRPGLNTILLDFYTRFNKFLDAPQDYGLTNTISPCLTAVAVCANPDEYLFWDEVHPTAAVGQELAEFFTGTIFTSSP
ncbi:gll1890 [Gloeobacter violaceus PCC 7421]|uniref:Gll1890 protein n=2 Tax=Gloeobacter violaceus TaxID=33072 RepID=Q7NJE2_GLOVI|nr:gll1890 [Gloeobacter violaceus PCC 7421]